LAAAANAGPAGVLRAGNKAYDAQKYGEAFDLYQSAAGKNAEGAAYNAAAALYRLKDYEGALAAYKTVAEKGGAFGPAAVFNAGDAAYMQGDKDAATAFFRRAVMLNPRDEAAIHNLQFVLQEKDKNNQERENKPDGDNKDKDENQENQQNQDGQNNRQQQNSVSKEEADNILQMIKDDSRAPQPLPQSDGAGGKTPPEKDW
jgi:tetratricopeptide (TPR) repeat protein